MSESKKYCKADVKAAEALWAQMLDDFAGADLDGKKRMLGLAATQMVKEANSGVAAVDDVKRALGEMIGLSEQGCAAMSLDRIVDLMNKCGVHVESDGGEVT